MNRVLVLCAALALVLGGMSCSSDLDDDEAVVFLTMEEFSIGSSFYTSVCAGSDVFIESMTIRSHIKGDADYSAAQDVVLTRWVVTPYRVDGGTTASPVYTRDSSVAVEAGGTADLANWPIYSSIFYNDPPLLYLFPENGGYDPETGERVVEQSLRVQWFGHTMSGQNVDFEFTFGIKFACEW